MIRTFQAGDLEAVMSIWLSANLEAHAFIDPEYWKRNFDAVTAMIPRRRSGSRRVKTKSTALSASWITISPGSLWTLQPERPGSAVSCWTGSNRIEKVCA